MTSELENFTEAGRDLGNHLVQHTPKQCQPPLSRHVSSQVLDIAQGEVSAAFLDKLFQCSSTLPSVQKLYRSNVF